MLLGPSYVKNQHIYFLVSRSFLVFSVKQQLLILKPRSAPPFL